MVLSKLMVGLVLLGTINIGYALQNNTNGNAIKPQHTIIIPTDIVWVDGPPSLPKGSQVVILEGNPSQAGPFTLRLKVPGDYKIPPHTHPAIEHITVLSGSVELGMGNTVDKENTHLLTSGTFAFMPPNSPHYVYFPEETILQLHGIGPWDIRYLNPAEDPRLQKKE